MAKSVEIIWTMKSKSDLKQIYTQLCTQIPEEKTFDASGLLKWFCRKQKNSGAKRNNCKLGLNVS
jgi:hypothetical protein